ncbi:hypothetical protein CHGG_06567 [Chaetomium globosum CBS 148.51]|uniref:Uncharacterized protein n=1 Tax=Chaetomium globosum (strain ATCC 6205 / CBS 148.51 / DSM 1962 / NBRC 6347 / NRRL 1970) TaxID=306901 RepID=Q2H448_CHAGB|nr:uncharacterized protein CHGG_06567 [Chaetomium globosum CBS 148.51]EAQ89948.1 hypothetical protein CHGG_06567 [Chaetomium globosum CBS 148.51]
MQLATEVFDKASDLGIDVDNIYDVELSLLANIRLIETKLKQNYGAQWDTAAKTLLSARETKLAALRDLSNTLDWVISPERAVVVEPRSSSVSDMYDLEAKIKTGKLQEKELGNLHSQLLATAIAARGVVHTPALLAGNGHYDLPDDRGPALALPAVAASSGTAIDARCAIREVPAKAEPQEPPLLAKPTAHQPRADNRHNSPTHHGTHTAKSSSSESRPTAPAALTVKPGSSHAAHVLAPGSGSGAGSSAAALTPPLPEQTAGAGPVRNWYPILFLCRLASIAPGVLFGLPNALRLLAMLHLMYLDRVLDGGTLSKLGRGTGGSAANSSSSTSGYDPEFEARLRLTEALLATIWCCASGYLSFFFTDCLMSRWLLHYTPQATIVRLLTVDAINGYLTSWVLHLTGGFEDPRLILPAWIVISTRKINIRKETSMSISVFSIASFVSMVALLVQLDSNRSDYPDIPLLNLVRRVFHEAGKLAIRIMEYGDITREL